MTDKKREFYVKKGENQLRQTWEINRDRENTKRNIGSVWGLYKKKKRRKSKRGKTSMIDKKKVNEKKNIMGIRW